MTEKVLVGKFFSVNEFAKKMGLEEELNRWLNSTKLVIGESTFQKFLETLDENYILVEPSINSQDLFEVWRE